VKRSTIGSAKHIVLGLLLVGSFASRSEAAKQKFYLTPGVFVGSQALTACAKGYHMASLSEIFDVSGLTYNTKLGAILQDSGGGPPATAGRIRTGFVDGASRGGPAAPCETSSSCRCGRTDAPGVARFLAQVGRRNEGSRGGSSGRQCLRPAR
jgi:hypothetical protein